VCIQVFEVAISPSTRCKYTIYSAVHSIQRLQRRIRLSTFACDACLFIHVIILHCLTECAQADCMILCIATAYQAVVRRRVKVNETIVTSGAGSHEQPGHSAKSSRNASISSTSHTYFDLRASFRCTTSSSGFKRKNDDRGEACFIALPSSSSCPKSSKCILELYD
jgi:hypothetical protein